jgi:transcriptional regulator with XRE-family HTH domain
VNSRGCSPGEYPRICPIGVDLGVEYGIAAGPTVTLHGMTQSTVITRELGVRLRACRERVGLTAAEVAKTLGWSTSLVSRLENGQKLADPVYMAMYLGCCRVPQDTAKFLLDLAREPDNGFLIRPYRRQWLDVVLPLIMNETAASTICNFELSVVPGLLQTANYAAAIARSVITAGPDEVEARVEARIARQALLSRPYPPQAFFFINESVLHYPICDPKDMSEQLLNLVLVTAKPQTRVRIVPRSAGAHAGMRGSFMHMGYTDRRSLVYLESEGACTFVEDREVVGIYRMIISELDRIALGEEESRSLLVDLASEYDRDAEERSRDGQADRLA